AASRQPVHASWRRGRLELMELSPRIGCYWLAYRCPESAPGYEGRQGEPAPGLAASRRARVIPYLQIPQEDPPMTQPSHPAWERHLDAIGDELVRLCIACDVRLRDPGVIDRILKNDDSVCGSKNPIGFRKLRA